MDLWRKFLKESYPRRTTLAMERTARRIARMERKMNSTENSDVQKNEANQVLYSAFPRLSAFIELLKAVFSPVFWGALCVGIVAVLIWLFS